MNLYSLLGVQKDSQILDIKKAYISIIKKHKPLTKNNIDNYRLCCRAYYILLSAESRKQYDATNIVEVDVSKLSFSQLAAEGRLEEIIKRYSLRRFKPM